jgi:KAP family P-loop domain
LLNIHGSWGSGKTSLLNFLRDELLSKKDPEWIVVEFNAWQNQQTGPPWLSLINAVFEQSVKRLRGIEGRRHALGLWIWEHLWRSWIKRSNFF